MTVQLQTFSTWIAAYKEMLVEKYQWEPSVAMAIDTAAYKLHYYDQGLTIEQAYHEDCNASI